jgi:hypothetical protein
MPKGSVDRDGTLRRWVAQGCNLNDPDSVEKFLAEAELKKTNVRKYQEARGNRAKVPAECKVGSRTSSDHRCNGETLGGPVGRTGAAAALERLETAEERAHARLEAALAHGDPSQIQACQDFWLKCSETFRRLDLAVELARRDAEEQVPKKRLATSRSTSPTGSESVL